MDTAMDAAPLRFSLADVALQPWRNGGGLTRTIAAGRFTSASASVLRAQDLEGPEQAGWDWRVSVGYIEADGPFSCFPGVDRLAALADARPLELRRGADRLRFERLGQVHAFAGEEAIEARLPAGPTRLFNAMARRGRAWIELAPVHGAARIAPAPDACGVLLAVAGAFEVCSGGMGGGTARLAAGEGLVFGPDGPGTPRLDIAAQASGACLLLALIRPRADRR